MKKYRCAGGIARGRAAAHLEAQRKHGAGADRKCGHNGFAVVRPGRFSTGTAGAVAAISGAGRVELMLSLDQTEESVYAVNTRQTSGSDSRSRESDVSVVSNGSCGETPVTVKRVLPVFRGAVVLCDGADDASVRLSVTQAVSTVCGIGADKVTVLKMQSDT
ncbi:MAG: hypothetical protein ACLT2F_04500 [Butyricicoccus sp.]